MKQSFFRIFSQYSKLLFNQQPLLVSGQVKDDQGAVILEVRYLETVA